VLKTDRFFKLKIRYVTYSISGLFGSTYVVKEFGSRNALTFGMGLYCLYVLAFYIATTIQPKMGRTLQSVVTIGAVLGGWGAGFLWTAQGAYFTRAAQLHHMNLNNNDIASSGSSSSSVPSLEDSTAKLASIFAFVYLSSEIGLRALSTFLLDVWKLSWSDLFAFYSIVALISTLLMMFVQKLSDDDTTSEAPLTVSESASSNQRHNNANGASTSYIWYKATAAWRLLVQDRKMKYMIGLNAVFGLTSAFLTSYVNGTVVRYVIGSDTYVGLLTAWVSCVAAISSVIFGYFATTTVRKGYVLMFGAVCFMCVAGSFIVYPNVSGSRQQWNWLSLVGVYTMHGIGRATFEGTLKSTFADYFAYEKEGAFANIILQNGLSSAIGFALTFSLHCSARKQEIWGPYCVMNKDGSVHDMLTFELLIVATAFVAIFGYHRASLIRRDELSRVRYEHIPTTAM
jgi:hypothetical protein